MLTIKTGRYTCLITNFKSILFFFLSWNQSVCSHIHLRVLYTKYIAHALLYSIHHYDIIRINTSIEMHCIYCNWHKFKRKLFIVFLFAFPLSKLNIYRDEHWSSKKFSNPKIEYLKHKIRIKSLRPYTVFSIPVQHIFFTVNNIMYTNTYINIT